MKKISIFLILTQMLVGQLRADEVPVVVENFTFDDYSLEGVCGEDTVSFKLKGEISFDDRHGGQARLLAGDVALEGLPKSKYFDISYEHGAYILKAERKGTFPLELNFKARISEKAGWQTVSFRTISSMVRKLNLSNISEKSEVTITGASSIVRNGENVETYLSGDSWVVMNWKKAAPKDEGKLFYSVEVNEVIKVGSGVLSQTHKMAFQVMQGELQHIKVDVEGSGQITQVVGENILTWNVLNDGTTKVLDIKLNRPYTDSYTFMVSSNMALDSFPVKVVPMKLKVVDAIRYSGNILVVNEGSVRVQVFEAKGITQVSPEVFPMLREFNINKVNRQLFSYRYSDDAFAFSIQADDIKAEVSASVLQHCHLGNDDLTLNAEIELDIREAAVRELSLNIPSGYSLTTLNTLYLSDTFITKKENAKSQLRIVFSRPVEGRHLLNLKMEKNDTLDATHWEIPNVSPVDMKTWRGYIGVSSEAGIRLTHNEKLGVTEIATAFYPRKLKGLQLAYRMKEPTWKAVISVEHLDASIQAEALHLYSIADNIAYGSSIFNYQISGAPVNKLVFKADESYRNIEITGKDVRHWKKEGDQYVVYLHSPISGAYTLLATFDCKLEASGLYFTGIEPLDVAAEQGHVVLVSEYPWRLDEQEIDGFVKLKPAEIPQEYRLLFDSPILASYHYAYRPYTLKLGLSPYVQGSMIDQVVDYANIKTSVSGKGEMLTEVQYLLKNKGHSHLAIEVAKEVRLWNVLVNKKIVTPIKDGVKTLIPLPQKNDPNEIIYVDLKMASVSEVSSDVSLATPKVDAPVLLTDWVVLNEDGYKLNYLKGNVFPKRTMGDSTGFQWLKRLSGSDIIRSGFAVSLMCLICSILFVSMRDRIKPKRLAIVSFTVLGLVSLLISFLTFSIGVNNTSRDVVVQQVVQNLDFSHSILGERDTLTVDLENIKTSRVSNGASLLKSKKIILGLIVLIVGLLLNRKSNLRPLLIGLGWTSIVGILLMRHQGEQCLIFVYAAFLVIHFFLPTIKYLINGFSSLPTLLLAVTIATSVLHNDLEASKMMIMPDVTVSRVNKLEQFIKVNKEHADVNAIFTWDAEKEGVFRFLQSPGILVDFPKKAKGLEIYQESVDGQVHYFAKSSVKKVHQINVHYQVKVDEVKEWFDLKLPVAVAFVHQVHIDVEKENLEFVSTEAIEVKLDESNLDNHTIASLLLKPCSNTSIRWKPKTRDLEAESLVFYSNVKSIYTPLSGVIEGIHVFDIEPSQGVIESLLFNVPQDTTITSVETNNLSAWRFDPQKRQLRILLNQSKGKAFKVLLKSQISATELPYTRAINVISIVGSEKQSGVIALASNEEVQLGDVVENKLVPINVGDFPRLVFVSTSHKKKPLALRRAYRYAEHDPKLTISVERVESDVRVFSKQNLSLGEDRVLLALDMDVSITRVGVFDLSFAMPTGMEIESISSASLSHWTEFKDPVNSARTIKMHLKEKTSGEKRFSISLVKQGLFQEKDFLIPRVVLNEANKEKGKLIVIPEQGMRLHVGKREGVVQEDPKSSGVNLKEALMFRLLQSQWNVVVSIEKVDSWVQASQYENVEVLDGVMKIRGDVFYQIENAGLKEFSIKLPKGAIGVKFTGVDVADALKVDDSQLWEIKTHKRKLGKYKLNVEYQLLNKRKEKTVVFSGLSVQGVDLQRSYFSLMTKGRMQINLKEIPAEIQKIDSQMLPENVRRMINTQESYYTFSVLNQDYQLNIDLQQHEATELLPAQIKSVDVDSYLSRSGIQLVETTLQLLSGDKRHLRVRLPENAYFWSAFVDKTSVQLWNDGNEILIPLDSADKEGVSEISFLYQVDLDNKDLSNYKIDGPKFDLPLENVTWDLYLPESWQLKKWEGSLNHVSTKRNHQVKQNLSSYVEVSKNALAEKKQKAQSFFQKGNEWLSKGNQKKARDAFSNAYSLSQYDMAFNEDARVQLNSLKTQQAVIGLINRRNMMQKEEGVQQQSNVAVESDEILNFTQTEAREFLQQYSAEDNEALSKLANRLVEQQNAAYSNPVAIQVTPPVKGHVVSFASPLIVNKWADMGVSLSLTETHDKQPKIAIGALFLMFVAISSILYLSREKN